MADIFLSYAREDEQRARALAAELRKRGWSVFWDRRIPHGKDFSAYIQEQLDAARCVMVLWSKASVASHFVRDEATEGLNGRLVPVLLEPVRQPLGFRQLQAADLSSWQPDAAPGEFDALVESITNIVRPSARTAAVAAPARPAPPSPEPSTANIPAEPEPSSEPSRTPSCVGGDFEVDVYVSAVHWDDPALIDGQKGWVTEFHRALGIRVGQLLGCEPVIWLGTQPDEAAASADRLRGVAVFVAVLSPNYVKSEGALGELRQFVSISGRGRLNDHSGGGRLFKVVKRPVAEENQPPELRSLPGYEFFVVDPDSGKFRVFERVFGPESERAFWLRLDDLAHDVSRVLEDVRREGEAAAARPKQPGRTTETD